MSAKTVLLFALMLVALKATDAQTDSLRIDGPREVQPGKLVCLTAMTTEVETPLWIVLHPLDLEYEQADGGRKLFFSSGCEIEKRITVLLLAQQVRGDRITTRQIRRTLEVKAEAESDEPGGDDRPTPQDPPLTSSPLFQSIRNAWPSIRTDAAKALSPQVAKNFEAVAARCKSGQIKEIAQIWKELSARNRKTLGIETEAWNPVAKVMQSQFKKLVLKSPRVHAIHLRATASAIRSAWQSNQDTRVQQHSILTRSQQ